MGLIVDAHLQRGTALAAVLRTLGHRPIPVVKTALDAIPWIADVKLDFIVVAPVWASERTAYVLRSECNDRGFDPILVCVAPHRDVKPGGFDSYLTHPFLLDQLDQALRDGRRTN